MQVVNGWVSHFTLPTSLSNSLLVGVLLHSTSLLYFTFLLHFLASYLTRLLGMNSLWTLWKRVSILSLFFLAMFDVSRQVEARDSSASRPGPARNKGAKIMTTDQKFSRPTSGEQ